MASTIISTDYVLILETGERFHVVEIDPSKIPEITDTKVNELLQDIILKCARMPRHVLESAKMGGTREFESLMSTPPIGCLLKLNKPVCAEINVCLMANNTKCSTRFSKLRYNKPIGNFPMCWEYDVEPPENDAFYAARNLASFIVSAWKQNSLVIIVDDTLH